MDPYRLPTTVVPVRYDLRLEPDLAASGFVGELTITVTVKEPATEIVLNAAELDVNRAWIANPDKSVSLRGSITLHEKAERCHLAFPASITPGTWQLQLSFKGTLNDKLRGFYRSKFKDSSGNFRFLAATQFEATDARRALPCWDEPAFKAVFATTLVIDPALQAVSNTSVVSEAIENGKKTVRFADTIPMSTYLLAFVVGDLEATKPVPAGSTQLRVWGVPGKGKLAAFGRDIGAFSLGFFEKYYDCPYPGDKLDLLAIPDFAAGAMENLGAITFRETALLVDEQAATHAELERVADVVAHENAHMWFGDLVTMSWWNGLWLNEAFATFMEMLAVDAWKPHWQRWTTFGVSRAAALIVDGLQNTRPIEYPVQAPQDADAMFDVLTYEKGASVLRMFEQYLGPDVFRDGVRCYLRKHAYGNTETGDLWIALGEAAKQPMPEIMDGWVFKPGYPLVTVRRADSGQLLLTQERFQYLISDAGTANRDQLWRVPVSIRVFGGSKEKTHSFLLTEAEMKVDVPADFDGAVVNAGGHGFYRVRYAPELLDAVLRRLPDKLVAIERFNLVNDAWATILAGLTPVTDYLELTASFRTELDKNVWAVLIGSFHYLSRIVEVEDRGKLETLVRNRLLPVATVLGWTPKPNEDELTGQLRGDLLRTLGTLGNDTAVQEHALSLYTKSSEGLDANVLAAVIAIVAHSGDAGRYSEFLGRFRAATTPQEEQRFLHALVAFRSAVLVEQTLMRTLNGEIRTQDAPLVLRGMLSSLHGRETAWHFVKNNWDQMKQAFPVTGMRRMCEGITALATPELEEDVRRFFAERNISLGGKTLDQYLEQLHIAVAFRQRERAALHEYLHRI